MKRRVQGEKQLSVNHRFWQRAGNKDFYLPEPYHKHESCSRRAVHTVPVWDAHLSRNGFHPGWHVKEFCSASAVQRHWGFWALPSWNMISLQMLVLVIIFLVTAEINHLCFRGNDSAWISNWFWMLFTRLIWRFVLIRGHECGITVYNISIHNQAINLSQYILQFLLNFVQWSMTALSLWYFLHRRGSIRRKALNHSWRC